MNSKGLLAWQLALEKTCQASHPIAADFGFAAIHVENAAVRVSFHSIKTNQPIDSYAFVTIAQSLRQA